jgi:MFS transporter, DHA3 family, macrolide efflux protein
MPAAIGVVLGLRVAGFLAHRVPHAALSTFGFMSFVVLLAMFTFVDVGADFLSGYGMFSWLGVIQIGNFDGGGVLAMIIVMPLGFAYATVAVAGQTVLNDNVPLHLQGRVLATQGAMAAIAASAPVLIAGALSDWIGVVPVMATLAVSIGVVAIANLRSPRVAPVYEPSVGR